MYRLLGEFRSSVVKLVVCLHPKFCLLCLFIHVYSRFYEKASTLACKFDHHLLLMFGNAHAIFWWVCLLTDGIGKDFTSNLILELLEVLPEVSWAILWVEKLSLCVFIGLSLVLYWVPWHTSSASHWYILSLSYFFLQWYYVLSA